MPSKKGRRGYKERENTDFGRINFIHGLAPIVEELPRTVAKRLWVAAVRRLANRDNRNPADPKVSRAQPP
ncbi:hypothetical protein D9M71_647470 [compost metagenome]